MKYRSEIGGLRALAVVPVILFHAGVSGLSGGFVGVDVFFVISGYLISGIIYDDLEAGRFSLLSFYERRARRILPALYLTLAISTVVAWLVLIPRDLMDFGQSLTASVTFLSNLYFTMQSGYFDSASELRPLLHTWSLAIEEQYYLLFPVLFGLCFRRWRKHILALVAGGAALGFGWSVIITRTEPEYAYYALSSRGWELLLGVLAMLSRRRVPAAAEPAIWREAGAFAGLLMITWSVITFDQGTAFPGPNALFPAGGTMLILWLARSPGLLVRGLSWPPLVGIGLISYSAYLFHQPMLAFLRILNPAEPALWVRLAVVVVVFPLAWLSWRYVEMPFRRRNLLSRRAIAGWVFSGTVALAGVGFAVHLMRGYVRFDLSSPQMALLRSVERSGLAECPEVARCLRPAPAPQDVLLIGDSHAFHFSEPLAESLAEEGRRLISLTHGGCFPSDRMHRNGKSEHQNARCVRFYGDVLGYLRSEAPKPRTAILSAAWAAYFYGDRYFATNPDQETPHLDGWVTPVEGAPAADKARRAAVGAEIQRMIQELAAHVDRVCVIAPLPYITNDFRGGLHQVVSGIQGVRRDDFLNETHELLTYFGPGANPSNARVLFPHKEICQGERCEVQRDGKYIYSDIVHVSDFGARVVFGALFASDPKCLGPG